MKVSGVKTSTPSGMEIGECFSRTLRDKKWNCDFAMVWWVPV